MLTYDADFSINLHFEINEEEAVKRGGISLSDVKKQIQELPDWIMTAIMEFVDFQDNDSITVIPYDHELRMDGRIIRMDEIEDEDENDDEDEDEIDEEDLDNSETVEAHK